MNSDKQVKDVNGSAVSYHAFVEAKTKHPAQIILSLSNEKMNLIHMAMGIAGEAGELLDAIKKHAIYNKPLDVENVIEELGDLAFYIQGMQNILCLSDSVILTANADKLCKRYKDGYSDKAAQDRVDKNPSLLEQLGRAPLAELCPIPPMPSTTPIPPSRPYGKITNFIAYGAAQYEGRARDEIKYCIYAPRSLRVTKEVYDNVQAWLQHDATCAVPLFIPDEQPEDYAVGY